MSISRRQFVSAALATAACGTSATANSKPGAQARAKSKATPTAPAVPPAVPPTMPITPTRPAFSPLSDEAMSDAVSGLHAFSTAFHAATTSPGANAISSPLSVALALAMVHAGARGETAAEIARALHLSADDDTVTRTAAALLAGFAAPSEHYELAVVDRLFGDQRVPFEPAYLDTMQRDLRAPLETMDFASAPEPSRARINAWVAEQTHDRIRDLLPGGAITAATKLVLANAVYFKAAWEEPFFEHSTVSGEFFAPDRRVDTLMMHRTGHMRWATEAGVQLLELPYDGGEFAMVLALPEARDGLAALTKGLDGATWTRWIAALRSERVTLALPKFKIEMPDPLRLGAICRGMGIERMFDHTRADFTAMAPAAEQLEISEGFHKAFIEVNEKGTEAAAATALSMRAGSAMPTEAPKSFVCDHPFAFAIRDTQTGAILFLGQVADPTAKA
jgi:serpin B